MDAALASSTTITTATAVVTMIAAATGCQETDATGFGLLSFSSSSATTIITDAAKQSISTVKGAFSKPLSSFYIDIHIPMTSIIKYTNSSKRRQHE